MNLFIDCTQKNFYLGIFENNSFVDKQIIPTNNNLTDIAIEYIGKLLTKNNLKKTDIKSIYLVLGPGSFTGVRVGILITQS
jgi:tRNA A37 threonylcarbamoyladenosine modification protein TsaB